MLSVRQFGAIGLLALIAAASAYGTDVREQEDLPVDGGILALEWRGEFSPAQRDKLKIWLAAVADTTRLLHGELPRERIRIALQPYPSKTAVPFARVLRQEPQGVLFYLNPEFSLEDFVEDWTAYHEFSHLFIPFPGRRDIWFSEGLASYYQNVLRARAGILTSERARRKLIEGFKRGRDDDRNSDLTLRELSPQMRKQLAFMRVYWSGALYFLEADLALRAGNRPDSEIQTLDDVLRAFGTCCLQSDRRWTGSDIAREFDRLAGTDLFVPLYRRYEQTTAIPDWTQLGDPKRMDPVFQPAR